MTLIRNGDFPENSKVGSLSLWFKICAENDKIIIIFFGTKAQKIDDAYILQRIRLGGEPPFPFQILWENLFQYTDQV